MKDILPRLLPVALLVAGPLQAQLPDDKHWFYEYGVPASEPFVMKVSGHHLYMGGLFLSVAGDSNKKNITRFNLLTEAWERVPGVNSNIAGGVWAIENGTAGEIFFGGNLTNIGGTAVAGVAAFQPSTGTWSPLTDSAPTLVSTGQGNGPTNGRVLALARHGSILYVGGEFTGPGGSPNNEKYIRRYRLDTQKWERLGDGLNGVVRALAVEANGNLIAGGEFPGGLARWNGSSWSPVGGGVAGSALVVRAVKIGPNGAIHIGGDFDTVNAAGVPVAVRDVATFHQGSWNALGGGFDAQFIQPNGTTFNADGVFSLALDGNGTLYAGGDFDASEGRGTALLRVARWDGSGAWKPLGSGAGRSGSQNVNAICLGPHGDLYAAGVFNTGFGTLGGPAKNFARWYTGRDFTGYVPGAADNTTSRVSRVNASTWGLSLHTRSGTRYFLSRSIDGMASWQDVGGQFTGNGEVMQREVAAPAGVSRVFFRFRADSY